MRKGHLKILDCALAMDGGSKALTCEDETGNPIHILLPQHVIPINKRLGKIPGRIHVNDEPLGVRSAEERELIQKLEAAEILFPNGPEQSHENSGKRIIIGDDINDYFAAIDKGPGYALAWMVKEIIDFVKSDEYVRVAELIDKKQWG